MEGQKNRHELVQRLVADPHDEAAIAEAHAAGQADPRGYAELLEEVGAATTDRVLSSHWYSEAANVWLESLSDPHRAAAALMDAVERNPADSGPAERLAELYGEGNDTKAIAALHERRVKLLAPLAKDHADVRAALVALHEELGRMWTDEPLKSVAKALEHFGKALEFDTRSQYSVYATRELLKAEERFGEAIPYFAMERALVDDPVRLVALFLDEAEVCDSAGESELAVEALRAALSLDPSDAALRQRFATRVLELQRSGRAVSAELSVDASQIFVGLAEQFPEHGLAYALCSLELVPEHDRGMQLALHYGAEAGALAQVAPFASEYVLRNPAGPLVEDARRVSEEHGVVAAPVSSTEAKLEAELQEAVSPVLPQPDPDSPVVPLLEAAEVLVQKNRRNEAAEKYREVLAIEPAQAIAIDFLQSFLRRTRRFGELRDTLARAATASEIAYQQRASWLREVASLSESQLNDVDGALGAWRTLAGFGPSDESSSQLRRLLEKAGRWQEVAALLRSQADQETDLEARIATEKDLSRLCESKLHDLVGAGEAWARIASFVAGDDVAIETAVKLFEQAGRHDLAMSVITDNLRGVDEPVARIELLSRLGGLRADSGDPSGAAQAYREAASLGGDVELWELAETSSLQAGDIALAVQANAERVKLLSGKPAAQAALLATAAGYWLDAGERERALEALLSATEKAPEKEEYAAAVEKQLKAAGRTRDLPGFMLKRAERLKDQSARVVLRKRAAKFLSLDLADAEGARRAYELVLQESDDEEALSLLADDAEARADAGAAVGYIRRLVARQDESRRVPLLLREAKLRHRGLKDLDGAVRTYQAVLLEHDPKNVDALSALAELELQRGNPDKAAEALERQLGVSEQPQAKAQLGVRLADLYEKELSDVEGALRVLQIVNESEPSDLGVVRRIAELAERGENWGLLARHLQTLAARETKPEEVSVVTRRLGAILHEKLDRSEDALHYLEVAADRGDEPCRNQFVALADELQRPAHAGDKLLAWYSADASSPRRTQALHGALRRFISAGDDRKVLAVAKDLARAQALDPDVAEALERVSVRAGELDVLNAAFELKARELTGPARAQELVRQAELLAAAGVAPSLAIQHGERALSSISPDRVEPLLQRLAQLADAPEHKLGVYERQSERTRETHERWLALSRAAQIAASLGLLDRAREIFQRALQGAVPQGGLEVLEKAARTSDAERGHRDTTLRAVLAEALAASGYSTTASPAARSALLCRAALLAHRDLGDDSKAFAWLADALSSHVSVAVLDSLNDVALDLGDHARVEAVLSAALEEVFDVPSVKLLLQRRAGIRRMYLKKPQAAAEDLKRLHELSPGDVEVLAELESLYSSLEDYRSLIGLYEDQILRGRDSDERALIARRVALLWRDKLGDPRETADAWRRVLRMLPTDEEARVGLARAREALAQSRAPGKVARTPGSGPTSSSRPGASSSRPPMRAASGRPVLDEDEEVRDEDLAIDGDSLLEESVRPPERRDRRLSANPK